uniref:Nudix hydrolase domain-containing protein n=1 Tax=Ditylum brightwellii TaxID=49249 RepID=A0A7S2EU43_9STRA|mmetsp:Transcript_7890/g.11751  ORF Transcript_7890/g.11751 Transcript_7890/m.11751 type:complete len:289 (+) Transcript_7890:19-885(+)
MIFLSQLMAQLLLRSNIALTPTARTLRPLQNSGNLNLPFSPTCLPSNASRNRLHLSTTSSGDNSSSSSGIAQDLSEMFDLYHPPTSGLNSIISSFSDSAAKNGQSKSRNLVHKDGDWHRSVHIWVVEQDNKHLLLQRRSPGKDTFPNCLDVSCAGHVTSGDDVDETAVRELEEELGMSDISIDRIKEARAFTIAASIQGQTPSHGEFICQEYQEVYILRKKGKLRATDFAPMMEEEVSGFEVASVKDVFIRLERKDEELVPRSLAYIQALTAAIFSTNQEGKGNTSKQ